jgi:mRNA interferase MazF
VPARYSPGEILLVALTFTSQAGVKRRPVLVIRDAGDDDLLVAPITSHPARVRYDVAITQWQSSGLRLPSVVRVEKLATVEKSAVLRPLGTCRPVDWASVQRGLRELWAELAGE